MFWVTANRIGTERLVGVEAHFRGESQIIGPMGELLARAHHQQGVGVVEIDLSLAGTGKLLGADFHEEMQLYPSSAPVASGRSSQRGRRPVPA